MNQNNYGSKSLTSDITKHPYVRCNDDVAELNYYHEIDINGIKHDLESLRKHQVHHITTCMECAGNSRKHLPYVTEGLQWDNTAVSNVVWTGFLLRDILTDIPINTKEIVFSSMDKEFSRSLPIDVIYNRPILIAYLMNGDYLPIEHGKPMRLIVPGWYGMASVKWLKAITFTDKPFEGKYQTQKYNYIQKNASKPVTTILPKSLITSVELQNSTIYGKAWSGCPIDKVEVRIDGKWEDADIVERTGDYGWVCWQKTVNLEGRHEIASRATDINGFYQPDEYNYNLYGYGNNAIQSIKFIV